MKGGIYPPFIPLIYTAQHHGPARRTWSCPCSSDARIINLSLQKNTERTQHYELASCHDVHAHAGR